MISKIIANMIKKGLSEGMSKEQFRFLYNRKKFDAIGMAQEVINIIKTKKILALVLTLYLMKAYVRVGWTFLSLVMFQIGSNLTVVNSIMACDTSTNFEVLINEAPSNFLNMTRGLRQGCPLSPLLFLIVIDGLSRLMEFGMENKSIIGTKIANQCFISHLLFVDDVMLFGLGTIDLWRNYKFILVLFSLFSGKMISEQK